MGRRGVKNGRRPSEKSAISGLFVPIMLLMSGSLASCNKPPSAQLQHDQDPILAIVGEDEIRLSAVKDELIALHEKDADNVEPNMQRQTLEALIDRDIVANEAMRRKIDRDPEVAKAIARAKARILVRAYMQELESTISSPRQEQVDQYYKQHPNLYSQRKLFKSDELTVLADEARQQVRTLSDRGASLRQVLLWLDQHDVAYTLKRRLVTGDELPAGLSEMANDLANAKPFIVDNGDQFQVWFMTVIAQRPQREDVAQEQITRALMDKQLRQEMTSNIASLRAAVGVVYPNTNGGSWHEETLTDQASHAIADTGLHTLPVSEVRK